MLKVEDRHNRLSFKRINKLGQYKEDQFWRSKPQGLGYKIILTCKCSNRSINSGPLINDKGYEINRQLVMTMPLLGIGHNGINPFCDLMEVI